MAETRPNPILSLVAATMIASGLLLALFDTSLLSPFERAVARSVWAAERMPEAVVTYHRFVHGALGGVIAGWGAMLWMVLRGAKPARAMAVGLIVWYAIDTTASLWWAVWPNAVLNTVVIVVAAAALGLSARR